MRDYLDYAQEGGASGMVRVGVGLVHSRLLDELSGAGYLPLRHSRGNPLSKHVRYMEFPSILQEAAGNSFNSETSDFFSDWWINS